MYFFLYSFLLRSISNAGSVQQCGQHFGKRGAGKMRMEASVERVAGVSVAGGGVEPTTRLAALPARPPEQRRRAQNRPNRAKELHSAAAAAAQALPAY